MMDAMNSYRDLKVWQQSVELCQVLYQITEGFPKSEQFGLTGQIRRAAVAIPSNIAEGQRRGTRKEYCYFVRVAYGSGAELETQLIIAQKVGLLDYEDLQGALNSLSSIMRMLNALSSALNSKLTY